MNIIRNLINLVLAKVTIFISKIRLIDYFYILLFLSYSFIFLFLRTELVGFGKIGPTYLLSVIADASLFFLLSLCFRGRWKLIVPVFPIFLSILILANCLHFRYFNDLISPSAYSSFSVFNQETFKGAILVSKSNDLLLFLFAIAPAIFFIIFRRNGLLIHNASKWFFISDIILLICSWATVIYKLEKNYEANSNLLETISDAWHTTWNGWTYSYRCFNFTGYILRSIQHISSNSHLKLTDKDRKTIDRVLTDKFKISKTKTIDPPDNLILIVVESFPAKLIESEIVSTVLPNLSRFISDSCALYIPSKVIPFQPNSSTAQFIYNTGLLPLREETVVLNYSVHDYPSIAKAKDWHTLEVIGEYGGMWNHFQTSKSYGFDMLVDNVAPIGIDQDSLIFNAGIMQLREMPTPFFLFLTTLSMHAPYNEKRVNHSLKSEDLYTDINEEIEYYNRAHFFDHQLGLFLKELKKMGKFDNTAIVIIGDHPVPKNAGVNRLDDDRVPLIIINSPLRNLKTDLGTQADIFPTILDIIRVEYVYKNIPYRGLGKSVFDIFSIETLTDEDFRVSEMIIKGEL